MRCHGLSRHHHHTRDRRYCYRLTRDRTWTLTDLQSSRRVRGLTLSRVYQWIKAAPLFDRTTTKKEATNAPPD